MTLADLPPAGHGPAACCGLGGAVSCLPSGSPEISPDEMADADIKQAVTTLTGRSPALGAVDTDT